MLAWHGFMIRSMEGEFIKMWKFKRIDKIQNFDTTKMPNNKKYCFMKIIDTYRPTNKQNIL